MIIINSFLTGEKLIFLNKLNQICFSKNWSILPCNKFSWFPGNPCKLGI